ncbi:hypothetical protein GF108_17945 [Phyllobacterium sp. SYP-B3895]|uniref:DUF6894 family protein n=1 Tax=Phyllobacterium sp. SYP-B3895 TaxID=2663240 RepID=UPI00129975C1|nr:hypothetical protein [Phyllobacterium sp. SYP-B3895]MRG57453.1 hypothetical protein [Phyllobacterium sp. SYP-B3895]
MPLFRFVFDEGEGLDAITPIAFPDHEAAIDAAHKAAKESLIDAVIEGYDPTTWVVRIYNEPGELLKTIFVSDLLRTKAE